MEYLSRQELVSSPSILGGKRSRDKSTSKMGNEPEYMQNRCINAPKRRRGTHQTDMVLATKNDMRHYDTWPRFPRNHRTARHARHYSSGDQTRLSFFRHGRGAVRSTWKEGRARPTSILLLKTLLDSSYRQKLRRTYQGTEQHRPQRTFLLPQTDHFISSIWWKSRNSIWNSCASRRSATLSANIFEKAQPLQWNSASS